MIPFEIATGSITGSEHLRTGRPNQDACHWVSTHWGAIATVCDGCGSSTYSQIGATLGARLTVNAIHQVIESSIQKNGEMIVEADLLEMTRQQILKQLTQIARSLGDDLPHIIRDYLLFTIVGVILTPTETVVFGLGDGAIAINGNWFIIPPFPNNAPPYLAYGLLSEKDVPFSTEQLQFQIHHRLPTETVQSILIGSDGVTDLIQSSHRPLPGKRELVGAIAQFWEGDRYFHNPDQIRRRLTLINREVLKPDWQNQQLLRETGLLPDDTTLIVLRRKTSH